MTSPTPTPSALAAQVIDNLPWELMPSEMAYLRRILKGQVLWYPQSIPQWLAFLSRADVLFYGGAAGGGKTDLGLGMAFECHQKTTFFRREFTQLADVVDRGDEISRPRGVKFNHGRRRWINNGQFVELGAIDHETDLQKYQGRPRDLYVFDEVSFFTKMWVEYITAWRRTVSTDQRTRVLLLGNPPTTPEGEWVVDYFAPWLDSAHPNPARPGELRWFATLKSGPIEAPGPEPIDDGDEYPVKPLSRTFVPAFLKDNRFLRDSGYQQVLQGLGGVLTDKLLYGLFDIVTEDDPWQVIPTAWVEAAQDRWKEGKRPDVPLTSVGADISRGGDDETISAKLYGHWFEIEGWPGSEVPDGPAAADKILGTIVTDVRAPIYVDVIGWGASAYDALVVYGQDAVAVNVQIGSTARDLTGKFGFFNLRSQLWWQFHEALDPRRGLNIALPPGRQLRADLCAPRFGVGKTGIRVEPKKATKARIHRSPDRGDAVLLAWYKYNAQKKRNYISERGQWFK